MGDHEDSDSLLHLTTGDEDRLNTRRSCDVLPKCHTTTEYVKMINKKADVIEEHPVDMKDAQKALKQWVNKEADPEPHAGCIILSSVAAPRWLL